MEPVAQTLRFELGVRGGIKLCFSPTVANVDGINITHKFEGLLLSDELMECAAEFVGDVIFSVGKSACTAETVHNRALRAANAPGYFLSVNRTMPLFQRLPGFKHGDLQIRPERR